MRKLVFLFSILLFFWSCDKKSKVEKAVDKIKIDLKVDRFDRAFFESTPQNLPKLKTQYPFFFPQGNEDSVWIAKMQNLQWRELYSEVQKKFPDFEPEKLKIVSLFKHVKYYFPKTKTPEIFTIISEMDYNNKVVYTEDKIIISLELYLGKNHKFYEYPDYIKQNFEPNQILPDLVSSFSIDKISRPTDQTLLSQMIYAGKGLYLKDLLLPEYSDADKIGYKPDQILWSKENEGYMWRYFIEKKLLFDTDQKLLSRFINPAPFSKFYLEIDNESPGRVGTWIGWQIVRSFVENNEVSLQELLQMDAKEIFEKSKYKPTK